MKHITHFRLWESATVTPAQRLKDEIGRTIGNVKRQIPPAANKIIEVMPIIDKFNTFLLSKIPEIIEKSKSGVGGDKWANECYTKILGLVDETLRNIAGWQIALLKLKLPKRDEFIKEATREGANALYFHFFEQLVDFPVHIAQSYNTPSPERDNVDKYRDQIYDWIGKNERAIVNEITKRLVARVYA